jgi:tetratricopeptide (TPR) repeat protein
MTANSPQLPNFSQISVSAQILWRHLAVFAGSFSLDAMRAVGVGEETLPLSAELISQEFLLQEVDGEENRYRLPAELRPIGQKLLVECLEDDAVHQKLITFYSQLAEQVLDNAFGPQRPYWINRLEQEHINLQATLAWLLEKKDVRTGLKLVSMLEELWFEDSYTSEGREWLNKFLSLPVSAQDTQRASALDLSGALALNQNDYSVARTLKEEGLAILRRVGTPAQIGYALLHLGHLIGFAQGDFETARSLYQEALNLLREAQHTRGIAHACADLGTVAILSGDFHLACSMITESLQRYQALGQTYDIGLSLRRAAGISAGLGHFENALQLAGAGVFQTISVGLSLPPIFEKPYEQMLQPARVALSQEMQAIYWKQGQEMDIDSAIRLALEEMQ